MARSILALVLCIAPLSGCDLLPFDEEEPNCEVRHPFWPDGDGDGVGDPGSSVYIGCEAPDGYVREPPPGQETDTAVDTGAPEDTGSPHDTDTHEADTDTDEAAADTDTTDSDTDLEA